MGLSTLMACIVLTPVITVPILYLVRKHKQSAATCGGASLPLPPGPVGLPFFRSALRFVGPFSRNRPHTIVNQLAKSYGPIVSFRPGMIPNFVVVSSPEAAREALVDNDAVRSRRGDRAGA